MLKEAVFALLKFCATRGVSVTIEETTGGIELQLDSVIYSDGFNTSVFEQVLDYLSTCVEKVEELVG